MDNSKYISAIEVFEFGVLVDDNLIAVFDTVIDRDDCLYFLAEKYKDCKFKPINF